jgi:hypothetical protein
MVDKTHPKYSPQIEAIQRKLQASGFYQGEIDGVDGPATQRAIALGQQMEPKKSDAEIQLEREQLAAGQSDKEAVRQQKREETADPLWDTFVPFGIGAGVGYGSGELANRALFGSDASKAAALKEIGNELGPTSKLTDSKVNRSRAYGASEAAKRIVPTSTGAKIGNMLGRATTYGVPAGILYNEWSRYEKAGEDPSLTETERQANRRIASGLLGALTGVGFEGGIRVANRILPEGYGTALTRIETARNLAERFDERDAGKSPASSGISRLEKSLKRPQSELIEAKPIQSLPPPQSPQSKPQLAAPKEQTPIRNMERLRGAVAAAGGSPASTKSANYEALRKGLTKDNLSAVADSMNLPKTASKATVLQRARELLRTSGKSGLLLPLAAAATAYELAGEPAEAGTPEVEAGTGNLSTTGTNTADRLGAATAAGGTVYGMDRLINALKGAAPNLTRSIGAGGVMTLPGAIADQFDNATPDELTAGSNRLYNQQARFQEATGLPDWLMGQNVAEARDMATVPERNPARVYENAYQPGGEPSGYAGGTHEMPDGSVMADSEMPPQQPAEEPPADAAEFEALSQAFEQDPEIAGLLREYVRSRIDMTQYQ